MTDSSGAFYSSQDADSEGEEGRFYVWTADCSLREALGNDEAAVAQLAWGIQSAGISRAAISYIPRAMPARWR